MKQVFLFLVFIFCALAVNAQKDVTTFLGIPIDGYRTEMFEKLKEKGFSVNPYNSEGLTGEFNGVDVNVYIATNNNKVWRIMLCDANTVDEGNIKIRFNRLCEQFENNQRYISYEDYKLSPEEDISYEMTVHNKKYDALFYQKPLEVDSATLAKEMHDIIYSRYTPEQLENPTEEITKEIFDLLFSYALERVTKKAVWFRITEYAGEYLITMFYDNEYNKANGEDL
jgi:hypothetical protein